METRNRKFGISGRRLGFLTTMFILLSVSLAEESRRCHWCGPLAEQVHRSARAMSCDSITMQITTCDPGYNYCATVATSPPYVESRYCVKLYQDECYPLYCNTTGSWKMACPCQGDLCNGEITEREKEAFQILAKLVTKSSNKRLKKRKTRFVRDSSNEVNSSLVNEKNTDDSSTTTANINDVNEEVTKQPTVESSMGIQSSSKQTDSNNIDMESTSVSLAINNNYYTIAIDGKPDKTTKNINEETSGPVTEPLISKFEEAETAAIISTQATTIENNVVVVTESVNDKEIEIKHDDQIKNNQVLVDTNNSEKEMQSDEPSEGVDEVQSEKKETMLDDEKKESVTTILTTTMVTDTTVMTTTKAILQTTTPTVTTTKEPKNNAQFLYSIHYPSLLLMQITFFLRFY